jgi:hypothetical protein
MAKNKKGEAFLNQITVEQQKLAALTGEDRDAYLKEITTEPSKSSGSDTTAIDALVQKTGTQKSAPEQEPDFDAQIAEAQAAAAKDKGGKLTDKQKLKVARPITLSAFVYGNSAAKQAEKLDALKPKAFLVGAIKNDIERQKNSEKDFSSEQVALSETLTLARNGDVLTAKELDKFSEEEKKTLLTVKQKLEVYLSTGKNGIGAGLATQYAAAMIDGLDKNIGKLVEGKELDTFLREQIQVAHEGFLAPKAYINPKAQKVLNEATAHFEQVLSNRFENIPSKASIEEKDHLHHVSTSILTEKTGEMDNPGANNILANYGKQLKSMAGVNHQEYAQKLKGAVQGIEYDPQADTMSKVHDALETVKEQTLKELSASKVNQI